MRLIIPLLTIGVLSLITVTASAQVVPPSAPTEGAILDSLAGILALIGAGYGVFKFRSNRED